ncbi:MAG: hypothetical protein U0U46_14610 [Saprospiraceae bacterium]
MRLLILLFFLLPATAVRLAAQKAAPSPDARLYEVYDADYLRQLQTQQPTLLYRLNYYLDHAFVVSEYPAEKGDISQFPVLRIANPERFNILVVEKEQKVARDWEKPVFYRIEGTRKVLMYWPGKEFNQKFRDWLTGR